MWTSPLLPSIKVLKSPTIYKSFAEIWVRFECALPSDWVGRGSLEYCLPGVGATTSSSRAHFFSWFFYRKRIAQEAHTTSLHMIIIVPIIITIVVGPPLPLPVARTRSRKKSTKKPRKKTKSITITCGADLDEKIELCGPSWQLRRADYFCGAAGAEGSPDRWKCTFCHFMSRRCHTRVSSDFMVCGQPDLSMYCVRRI